MPDLVHRFSTNPLIVPHDIAPTRPEWDVEYVINPGVFRYNGKVGLLLRVAERPPQDPKWVSTPVLDASAPDGVRIVRYRIDDPELHYADPRIFSYRGVTYLTTLSHLRLAWSDDGIRFDIEPQPALSGIGPYESYGLEDARVLQEGQEGEDYYITCTAVSGLGVAVLLLRTRNWREFERLSLIFPPHNKDTALFESKIGGQHYAIHRPSGAGIGGNYIWIARSPDLLHWGDHRCIATTRNNGWEEQRIGAGASPIRTDRGWLELYHAADAKGCYRLALLLLDINDPYKVLARSSEPVMLPDAEYEQKGFIGGVVFTNGHLVDGDTLTFYYGAADTVTCAATVSIKELLATL